MAMGWQRKQAAKSPDNYEMEMQKSYYSIMLFHRKELLNATSLMNLRFLIAFFILLYNELNLWTSN